MIGHGHYFLRLRDNQSLPSVWEAITPAVEQPEVKEALVRLLSRFAGYTPAELSSAGGTVLHDPASMEADGSSDTPVFTVNEPALTTFNAMGVLRLRDEHLRLTLEIRSRFDPEQNQFFLNYLLHRVFGGSFTEPVDLGHSSLWELLLILVFRSRLLEACSQGLFKRYTRFEHNDANFRGTLNLNRHLRRNVPFVAAVAYTTHEFSHDTPVTRLIRSALWHIENKYPRLLDGTEQSLIDARQGIERNTPSWRARHLVSYLKENLRPLRHPYFTAYEPLRQVCLAVLKGEGAALYEDDPAQEVEGVIFDGAWLWEHYLASLVVPLGMTHCLYGQNGIPVFRDRSRLFYPDFYHKTKHFILDAKYKREPAREDIHQVLAYMYLSGAKRGGVILPPDGRVGGTSVQPLAIDCESTHSPSFWAPGTQAFWHQIVFQKPSGNLQPEEFIQEMKVAEGKLQGDVEACFGGTGP